MYCQLIGRDDENIQSSCVDQSDDTIHLLRYMHTKQQRWPRIRFAPITRIQSNFIEKYNGSKTVNDRASNCLFKGMCMAL